MYRLFCRACQIAFRIAYRFLDSRAPTLIEGPGSVLRLPERLKADGATRVLVVTGNHLFSIGAPDPMLAEMERLGLGTVVFHGVTCDPTDDQVEAGWNLYRSERCDAIVALGGGTPIDCAKAIAAKTVRPDRPIRALQGLLRVRGRIPLFAAVPTTAGTGSEATVAAVITDRATHRKASINDPSVLPAYAVLDPLLTVGLPPRTTAETGMDALSHAVEAYLNRPYRTEETDRLAREAVSLIHRYLPAACRDGGDLAARQALQRAAFDSGRAISRACVGYTHAVGHALGGLYGIRHGAAMGILLPHVLRQYGAAAHARLADLADACALGGDTPGEKVERFIAWIEALKRETGIPERVEGIRKEDVPQIIRWAMREANPLYPVPVIWRKAEFRRFLDTVRA